MDRLRRQSPRKRLDPLPEPLLLLIANAIDGGLLRDIQGGRFDSAGRLPSEHELAERFGVNRHTARQAIAGLGQGGAIFERKGGGSYLVPGAANSSSDSDQSR